MPLVERGGDALGDDLLEQGIPEARAGKDPDAVVDLMRERTRQPELHDRAEAGLRRLPERDDDASVFRAGKTVGAGLGDDPGAAAGIGHGDGRRGPGSSALMWARACAIT